MISWCSSLRCCKFPSTISRPLTVGRRIEIVRAAEKEVHCYVNDEGHLVCDRLDPGEYVVKRATESGSSDYEKPPEGAAFCYITDTGELICEGLPEGNYTIERATEKHMSEMLAHMQRITTEKAAVEEEATEEIETKEEFDPKTGVRCYVNADGVMVCENLEPGDYVVKPAPGSEAKSKESVEAGVTYCYITDTGELLCEGMEEGEYSIEKATDDDLEKMLIHVDKMTQKAPE